MVHVFVHANGALAPTSVLKLSSKSTWREFIAAAAERLGFGDNYLLNVARPTARIFLSADGAEVKCLDDLEDGDTLSVSLDGSSWRPVPRQLKGLHAAAGLPASSKLPSGWSPRCNAEVFTAPPKSPQGPASAASPSTASSSARNMPADPMAHPIADPIADPIARGLRTGAERLVVAERAGDEASLCATLRELARVPRLSAQMLERTGAGVVVATLKRHSSADVASLARQLVVHWKTMLEAEAEADGVAVGTERTMPAQTAVGRKAAKREPAEHRLAEQIAAEKEAARTGHRPAEHQAAERQAKAERRSAREIEREIEWEGARRSEQSAALLHQAREAEVARLARQRVKEVARAAAAAEAAEAAEALARAAATAEAEARAALLATEAARARTLAEKVAEAEMAARQAMQAEAHARQERAAARERVVQQRAAREGAAREAAEREAAELAAVEQAARAKAAREAAERRGRRQAKEHEAAERRHAWREAASAAAVVVQRFARGRRARRACRKLQRRQRRQLLRNLAAAAIQAAVRGVLTRRALLAARRRMAMRRERAMRAAATAFAAAYRGHRVRARVRAHYARRAARYVSATDDEQAREEIARANAELRAALAIQQVVRARRSARRNAALLSIRSVSEAAARMAVSGGPFYWLLVTESGRGAGTSTPFAIEILLDERSARRRAASFWLGGWVLFRGHGEELDEVGASRWASAALREHARASYASLAPEVEAAMILAAIDVDRFGSVSCDDLRARMLARGQTEAQIQKVWEALSALDGAGSSLSAKMVFGKATAASPAGTQPTLGLTALRLGLRRARADEEAFVPLLAVAESLDASSAARAFADLKGGGGCFRIPDVARRAISLDQLRQVIGHVARRLGYEAEADEAAAACKTYGGQERPAMLRPLGLGAWKLDQDAVGEQWLGVRKAADGAFRLAGPLTLADVNTYDLVSHVLKPATKGFECSLVELMATEEQPPDYFVAHVWGEPLLDCLRCLVHHAWERGLESEYGYHHGRDMQPHPLYLGGRSPRYWLDAYAQNHHNLDEEFRWGVAGGAELEQSALARALRLARGAVSVIDRHAVSLERVWCVYAIAEAVKGADDAYGTMWTEMPGGAPPAADAEVENAALAAAIAERSTAGAGAVVRFSAAELEVLGVATSDDAAVAAPRARTTGAPAPRQVRRDSYVRVKRGEGAAASESVFVAAAPTWDLLTAREWVWEGYGTKRHEAIAITDGLSAMRPNADRKREFEECFPAELLDRGLSFSFAHTRALVDEDRTAVLGAIGDGGERLDEAVHAMFATAMLRRSLEVVGERRRRCLDLLRRGRVRKLFLDLVSSEADTQSTWSEVRAALDVERTREVAMQTGLRMLPPSFSFGVLAALTALDLSGCVRLVALPADLLRGCIVLASVKLRGCESLATLPVGIFGACPALAEINLAGCEGLSTLPETVFDAATALAFVDLRGALQKLHPYLARKLIEGLRGRGVKVKR